MSILRDLRDPNMQRSTWITHGLGSVALSLVTLVAFGTYTGGAWLAVMVFIAKERADKRMHLARGDYDTPDASGVAARSDHVGDLLGPIAHAVGATMGAWL